MPSVVGVRSPDVALLRAGVLLFLLGLLTGLAAPAFPHPRLGLSSHVQGIMNGMVLVGLGLLWPRLALGRAAGSAAFWAAIYGTFANWLAVLLAASWSAGGLMPIAGQGAVGSGAAEAVVGALLASLSVAMIAAAALALWGLRDAPGRRGA